MANLLDMETMFCRQTNECAEVLGCKYFYCNCTLNTVSKIAEASDLSIDLGPSKVILHASRLMMDE